MLMLRQSNQHKWRSVDWHKICLTTIINQMTKENGRLSRVKIMRII